MRWNTLARTKVACAYFFVVPGLVYALLVSRLPALKEQVGANEAEVGFILLSYGLSGLVGLILSAPIIRKLTSRRVLRVASLSLLFALPVTALATSPLTLGLACICVGLGTGFVDVAMNAQAIEVEKHHNVRCLAFMHAGYGLGGMLGSVSAAVFAGIGVSPLWNFGLLAPCHPSPLHCAKASGRHKRYPKIRRDRLPGKNRKKVQGPCPAASLCHLLRRGCRLQLRD